MKLGLNKRSHLLELMNKYELPYNEDEAWDLTAKVTLEEYSDLLWMHYNKQSDNFINKLKEINAK